MGESEMAKKESSTLLGYEDKLWLAADKLRGSMDSSEYKHVALGLIFLKYVSDAFGVSMTNRTNVATKEGSYATNVKNVYAAGDTHRGQSLVVWGINEGRHVAKEVDQFLMGYTNLD